MTPQELAEAVDARRRELGMRCWWQVAVALDIDPQALRRLRAGAPSDEARARAKEWLRRPVQPRKE